MKLLLVFLCLQAFRTFAQTGLDAKVEAASKQLVCPATSERDPVTINAAVVEDGDSIGVVIKVAIEPGWHIYDYVRSTMPFVKNEMVLVLPPGITAVGDWVKTVPIPSMTDPGVLIYEDEALFIHKAVRSLRRGGLIKAGLYYQTCNLRQCLRPTQKTMDLSY